MESFITFPSSDVTHRPNPKKDRSWSKPRHVTHKACTSAAWFELGVGSRKKGQYRKKTQKNYISHIWVEAPTEAIYIKNCVLGDFVDVITCAKFQDDLE